MVCFCRRIHRVPGGLMVTIVFMKWQDLAACRGTDLSLWFPAESIGSVKGKDYAAERARVDTAKRICQGCPVSVQCFEFSIRNECDYGIWGGLTERERQAGAAA